MHDLQIYILYACLLSVGQCLILDFGFTIPTREVLLPTKEQLVQAGVTIPVHENTTELVPFILGMTTALNTVKNIPAYQPPSAYLLDPNFRIAELINKLGLVIVEIHNLDTYKNNATVPPPLHPNCNLDFNKITPTELMRGYNDINTIVGTLSKTVTEEELNNSATILTTEKSKIIKLIELINPIQTKLMERLALLEGFSNKIINGAILASLQTKDCIESGKLENTEITNCLRASDGLYCTLSILMKQNQPKFTLYESIAYFGYLLTAEHESQYILKKEGGGFYTADCKDDFHNKNIDNYDNCKIKPYSSECAKMLESRVITDYLNHCNFTLKNYDPFLLTNESVLIQEGARDIILKDKSTKIETPVNDPLPLLIKTNKIIKLTTPEGKIIEIIPRIQVTEETIVHSWITPPQRQAFLSSINQKEMLENIEIRDIFDLVQFFLLTILVPIIVFIVRKIRKSKADHQNMEFKLKRRDNFRKNRYFTPKN